MTEVPAGWYTNPDDPAQLRWWTGTAWSSSTAPRPTSSPKGSRAIIIIVGSIIGFFAIVGLFSSGIGGFLAMLGFGAGIVAVVALVKGSARSLFLKSRPIAGAALAASFVIMIVGGALSPVQSPASLNVAQTGSDTPGVADVPEDTESAAPTRTPSPTPSVTTRREESTSVVPFAATTVDDPGSDIGSTTVVVAGINGEMTTTWKVTYADGKETDRIKLSERVTVPPVGQVTAIGSRAPAPAAPAAPSCDPNYSGPCVPIASDVDCAGGSGNGPAYVAGPVTVIGSDIYDLDRDGDGTACD